MAFWHGCFVTITSSLHNLWVGLSIFDSFRHVSTFRTASRAGDILMLRCIMVALSPQLSTVKLTLIFAGPGTKQLTMPENPIVMELWSIELVTADSYNVRVSTESNSSIFPVAVMTICAVKLYCWPVPVVVWMLSGITTTNARLPDNVIRLALDRAIWPKTTDTGLIVAAKPRFKLCLHIYQNFNIN